MKVIRTYTSLLLAIFITVSVTSCGTVSKPSNLMDNILSATVPSRQIDTVFIESMADVSLKLFKNSITNRENSIISPLSVILALAIIANGADGETLAQIEALLGIGISLTDLNEYLHSYINNLPSTVRSRLKIANSLWFRDDNRRLHIERIFLQINADYYNTEAFTSEFNENTINDINSWVNVNTDGLINEIINNIDPNEVLYIVNTVLFDAIWSEPYVEHDIERDGIFTNIYGESQSVEFMHSKEGLLLDDGMATGFIKTYADGYSFLALLPNIDVPIESYIESLTGAMFMDILANVKNTTVETIMPKFEYEYEIRLNDILKDLGITDAFDHTKADFSNMASMSNGNIYISEVLHKAYIKVDERGTKAGASTMARAEDTSSNPNIIPIVRLNRPFIYAIIDNASALPIFIGTVMLF